jgi:Lon protease-like protein
VKAPHRSALFTAGFAVALAASALPSVAGAQRQQLPGPDTKKVLVSTFRGDVEGGIRAADEIRNRIQGEYSIRTLMPISKKDIDANLAQSGYRPDSALNPTDIKELARLLRADEIIDGTVTKTAAGNYRVQVRMFLPRDVQLSQPLGTFESKDFGQIAKQVVDEYDRARKAIPDNQACENGIRNGTPAAAIAAARKGIVTYGKSTLTRLCLASAYAAMATTADSAGPWKDSVIAITSEITQIDSMSQLAYRLSYAAYKAKKDTANSLRSLVNLLRADPTNSTLRDQVIAELVQAGKAELAIPIAQQLVADNAGDPQYAKTYWLVLRAAKKYKESVAAGVALAQIDSSAADSSYFDRQIADLQADSSFAKAAEMAAMAAAKYPKRTDYLIQEAQNERRAGQIPAAKATLEKALAIDPKTPGANYLLASISVDLNNIDDVIKYAKADAAVDPANKARAAQAVLGAANTLYKAAGVSKSAADYKKAMAVFQTADEIQPNPQAKFFIATSALQTVAMSMESLQKNKSCDEFKAANELLTTANINIVPGAAFNKDGAGQIMSAAQQLGPFIEGNLKNLKCK